MTRKDELTARAQQIVSEMPVTWVSDQERKGYDDYVLDMLQQVEREVLSRCQDKIESLMEKENESTDDQVWEYRDWLKDQQKELG